MIVLGDAVFVHIQKTGGTSVTNALAIHPSCYFVGKYVRPLSSGPHIRPNIYQPHMLPEVYPTELFKNKRVFTLVRNPWARMLSWWIWERELTTFEVFVQRKLDGEHEKHLGSNIQSTYFQNFTFDHVGKMENIQDFWKELQLSTGYTTTLPHHNRSEHAHYSEHYNQKTIDLVAERESYLIEKFDYKYEERDEESTHSSPTHTS
jgi:hypothetical protein